MQSISTNDHFEHEYLDMTRRLLASSPVSRGNAHAMNDDTTSMTHEILGISQAFLVPEYMGAWQVIPDPNLPWAEDHFQERVGGEPLNPAPSEAWWPFARQGNAEHKRDEKFSHTYPERFWPKRAGLPDDYCPHPQSCIIEEHRDHSGIRFQYGDLRDLVAILHENPMSRQAYLPVWFPEDLAAAKEGERVPCSLGYHFIADQPDRLNCVYTMRSCDIVRFYRDDVYMAGRLLQWVASEIYSVPGKLVVHINNLHCFPGDVPMLNAKLGSPERGQIYPSSSISDKRAGYNFDALG